MRTAVLFIAIAATAMLLPNAAAGPLDDPFGGRADFIWCDGSMYVPFYWFWVDGAEVDVSNQQVTVRGSTTYWYLVVPPPCEKGTPHWQQNWENSWSITLP